MRINGNLQFHTLGAGELQNALIERLASDPSTTEAGRIYYNTTDQEYRYYSTLGSPEQGWLPFGEGQLAERLRIAGGDIYNTDGSYDAGTGSPVTGLNSLSNISGTTNIFEALEDLNNAITAAAGAPFRIIDGDSDTIVETEVTAGGDEDTIRLRLNATTTDDIVASFANATTTIRGADLAAGGGTLNLEGGDATAGVGGATTLTGGDGGGANAGGGVTIEGGTGGATGVGGTVTLNAGDSNGTNIGGQINLNASNGGAGGADGGGIGITAGDGTVSDSYQGGNVTITAGGDGDSTSYGGIVTLQGGSVSAGTGGNVLVTAGEGATTGGSVHLRGGTGGTTEGVVQVLGATSALGGELRFQEASANGTDYIAFDVTASIATSVTYTLPEAPAANNYLMQAQTDGTLAWVAPGAIAGRLENLADVTASTSGSPGDDVEDSILVYNATTHLYVSEAPATARTSLGLAIGSDVQAWDSTLDDLSGLGTVADNEFIVGSGAGTFAFEDEATVRTTLGLVAGGVGDIWVEKAGDTMSGALAMGSNQITGLADGTSADHAINLSQLQAAQAGILVKGPVEVATTQALDGVGNGAWTRAGAGAGKTLTAGAAGTTTIDGVVLSDGDRVLVKDEGIASPVSANIGITDNGIYVASDTGAGAATVLTRATDFDGTPTNEVQPGSFTFVNSGTLNDKTGWVLQDSVQFTGSPPLAQVDAGSPTFDELIFVQFQGLPQFVGGDGIDITGDTISVDPGAGLDFDSGLVRVDVRNAATTSALILTTDGTSREETTSTAELHLLIEADTGLEQGASGLAGIDATAGGTGSPSSGTKGVASFDGDDFSVTAGVVSLSSSAANPFRIIDGDSDTIVETEVTAGGDQDTIRGLLNTTDVVFSFANATSTVQGRDNGAGGGGNLILQGGEGTGGVGGYTQLLGGDSASGGTGGQVNITGGDAGGDGNYGGAVIIAAGTSTTSYAGSQISLTAGDGGAGGAIGGNINILAGDGTSAATNYGGRIAAYAGNDGLGTSYGGRLVLGSGGYAGVNVGGDVTLTAGGGATTDGAVVLANPTSSATPVVLEFHEAGNFIGLTAPAALTTDFTYTLPEAPVGSPADAQYLTVSPLGVMSWDAPTFTTRLEDLSDVTAATGSPQDDAGSVLVMDGTGTYVADKIQFNYDSTLNGGAATTHTVTHNLGQQFVNVTVYETAGSPAAISQIIPDTVVLTSANVTTITFTSAIDCYVVVTGVPGVPLA